MDNGETVRRIYEHLNHGEIDAMIELCDDEFVIDMSGRVFNSDTYDGPDGIRRFYDGVMDLWASYYHWDVEETRRAGDSVVAMLHCTGQSRETGPEVDFHVAWLWTFRGTTPVAVRYFRDRTEALEAAGLPAE